DSRIETTKFLISSLEKYAPRCKTLINASAIGIYGEDQQAAVPLPFTENEPSNDTGFVAQLCRQWEQAALQAHTLRVVILRIGIVLGKEGGAFPQFYKPLQMGVMPILGNGKQIMSWIHINDLAAMFLFALQNEKLNGTYNAVAPH